MRKTFFLLGAFGIGALLSILFIIVVRASSPSDITFPVAELGNCANEKQCKTYCDKPDNQKACIAFARSHGLIASEEADEIEQKLALGVNFTGPGGCKGETECRTYCENIDHLDECLAFGEQHGLMKKEELDEAQKVAHARKAGASLPGNCTSKASCDAYCSEDSHVTECVDFAEKAGFISPQEANMARQTGGRGPGGCRMKECDVFCEKPENFETCVDFAAEHGLMNSQELAEARKVAKAIMEKGVHLPGGCRSKEQCDAYCANPENVEECVNFATAAGFMTEKEAAIMKKRGTMSGPGGCRSEVACRAYCDDQAHAEECIQFAVDAGMMDSKEAERTLQMMKRGVFSGPGGCKGEDECRVYCDDPAHGEECVRFAIDNGFMDSKEGERALRMMQKGLHGGPGGCKGQEECEQYCSDSAHARECVQFGVDAGDMSQEEADKMFQMMEQGGHMGPNRESSQQKGNGESEFGPSSLPEGFEHMPPEEQIKFLPSEQRERIEKMLELQRQFGPQPGGGAPSPQETPHQEIPPMQKMMPETPQIPQAPIAQFLAGLIGPFLQIFR